VKIYKKVKDSEMSAINQAEVKKQVEYYLSDKNLVQDEFFRSKIQADSEVRAKTWFLCRLSLCLKLLFFC